MTYVAEKNLKFRTGNTVDYDYESTQCYRTLSTTGTTTTWGSAANEMRGASGDQWEGWDIPDYHKRLSKGELMPMTPWQRTSFSNAYSDGDYDVTAWVKPGDPTKGYHRYFYNNGWTPYGQWLVTEDLLFDYAPAAYDMYVAEAAAKIYSQGYDALTSLAELTEVKTMFVDIAKRLWKLRLPDDLLRRLIAERYSFKRAYVDARGMFHKAKGGKVVLIKDVMSDWLCVRYGWRTLIYDLMSLNETIKNLNAGKTRFSERVGTKWSSTETEVSVYPYAFFTSHVTTVRTVKIGIRGSVVADIDVPQWQFNPIITAWELIPLSFVWDWVINVGKTLAAYNFLAFEHRYAAAAGYSVKIETSLSNTLSGFSSFFRSGSCYQTAGCERTLLVRKPCKVPLLPSVVVRLNSLKVMDLVALVAQRLGAKSKGARI